MVPVWRDCLLDADTPVSAFAKLRRGPFAFLLESAPAGGETWSRYTFLGTEPRSAWRLRDGVVEDWLPERGWHNARRPDDPLADLRALIDAYPPSDVPELGAFWSGAVGYFSYDVVRLIEKLPHAPPRGPDVPDGIFVFTRAVVIIDNLRAQARVVVGVPVARGAPGELLRRLYDDAVATVDETIARLREQHSLPALDLERDAAPAVGESSYARSAFVADVEKIREYIFAGDAFQVLLARRIVVPHDFPGEALYRALRVLNPSPYMYHLVLDGVELVGSSPELLVRVSGSRVTVRPIAGTRPRGRTPGEDDALTAELLADEKERAEHMMLVDLGRNDVGRIARYGSVEVTDFMTVERYSHVLHIVSEVRGTLPADASAIDVFRAVFPAGTMTGAPKVRAMQLISELEQYRRGPYAGAVLYALPGEAFDACIAIRTIVLHEGTALLQAGAGIVADSDPAAEHDECLRKLAALERAIELAEARA